MSMPTAPNSPARTRSNNASRRATRSTVDVPPSIDDVTMTHPPLHPSTPATFTCRSLRSAGGRSGP